VGRERPLASAELTDVFDFENAFNQTIDAVAGAANRG
jgi:hypothetical protein